MYRNTFDFYILCPENFTNFKNYEIFSVDSWENHIGLAKNFIWDFP